MIVTGGEHFAGLATIRALHAAGYQVWATVVDERGYAAFSRLAGKVDGPDPAVDPTGFARALVRAVQRVGAEVVLPGNDAALVALSTARESFPPETKLGVSPLPLVERATSKAFLASLAESCGFASPRTTLVDATGLASAEIPFPAVVKPLRSDTEGADGVLVHGSAIRVENENELRAAAEMLGGGSWLVQPYVHGDLVAIGGVSWNGETVAQVHQVAHRIWPPDCGGSSFGSTIAPDPERAEKVTRLISDLGWSGVFQVQLLRQGDTDFLIDFNPRVYGTVELARRAGVNLPALWVELLRGADPGPLATYRPGVRFRAGWKDVRALHAAAVDGRWREVGGGLTPRSGTAHPVFSWRDPLPVVAGTLRVLGKARTSASDAVSRGADALDKSAETS